ncbi:MAG TPA: hypothetical protein VHS03_15170, partial [Gaiellaceae bacterium]|nr:hypothetical protein [Gaiellaceae bacterium]
EVLSLADLGTDASRAGEAGSRTEVYELQPPPPRGDSVRIEGDASSPEKIVEYLAERKLI